VRGSVGRCWKGRFLAFGAVWQTRKLPPLRDMGEVNGWCGKGWKGCGAFQGGGRELGAEWSCRYRGSRNAESAGKDEEKGQRGRDGRRTKGDGRVSTVRPRRIIALVSDEYPWMLRTWLGRDGLISTGRGRGMVGAWKGDGKVGSGRKGPRRVIRLGRWEKGIALDMRPSDRGFAVWKTHFR